MSTYDVTKGRKGWTITHKVPGWINPLPNTYGSRVAAITAARLLAGWRGKVTVNGHAIST